MTESQRRVRWILVAIAVLVAAGVGAWFHLGRAPEAGTGGSAPPSVATAERTRGPATAPKLPTLGPGDRTAAISGTVRDERGRALSGARVCAAGRIEDLSRQDLWRPACASSGPDGRYRIDRLWPIRYEVTASAPDHGPARAATQDGKGIVALQPGSERTGVDLTLPDGGIRIAGVVRDLSGGVVGGAWIEVTGGVFRDPPPVHVEADGDGRFEAWVAPGSAFARAEADGYAPGSDHGPVPGHAFEILLTPESVIVGVVVDAETDEPVAGAEVFAGGTLTDRDGPSARSGPDGSFRIERLEPGRYKPRARTDRGEGLADHAVQLGLAETSDPVRIALRPAARVEGRVVFAGDGAPCHRGEVHLEDETTGQRLLGRIQRDGRVRLLGVPPGHYTVGVECEGMPLVTEGFAPVEVAREPVTGLVWSLDRGLAIRGIVVDDRGHGLAEVPVSAGATAGPAKERGTRAWTETDASGAFELTGLLPGTYAVSAGVFGHRVDAAPPAEPVEVVVEPGRDADGVRIEFSPAGTVAGRVVDEDGDGVGGVTVTARGARGGWPAQARTADDGSFEIRGLDPGRYRLDVRRGLGAPLGATGDPSGRPPGERVEVRAGRTTEVELAIPTPDGEIRGRVVADGDEPVPDAFVSVQREPDRPGADRSRAARRVRWGGWFEDRKPVLTDADGNFTVEGLDPGTYVVYAARRGGGDGVVEHVAVGETVTVRIEAPGTISGTVTVRGGGVPDRMTVSAYDRATGASVSERYAGGDGAFTLAGVPPGTYRVRATAPDGVATVEGVEVRAGRETSGVRLEIAGKGTVRGRIVALDTGEPVAGFVAIATPAGAGFTFGPMQQRKGPHISGDDGVFELHNVAAGATTLYVWPLEPEARGFASATLRVDVRPGATTDVGDVAVVRDRTEGDERAGDLGFTLAETPGGEDPTKVSLTVAFVRPGGPAAAAGLAAGDEIVSVDGVDVRGNLRYRYRALVAVPEGTTVELGTAGGKTVRITAGPPPP